MMIKLGEPRGKSKTRELEVRVFSPGAISFPRYEYTDEERAQYLAENPKVAATLAEAKEAVRRYYANLAPRDNGHPPEE